MQNLIWERSLSNTEADGSKKDKCRYTWEGEEEEEEEKEERERITNI